MKLITMLFLFAVPPYICLSAAGEDTPLEHLVRVAKDRGMDYSLGAINDNLGFFRDMPEFARLVAEIESVPTFFSKATETRSLTKPEQEIVITAAWSLPDDKYLLFAKDAVLEVKNGRMQWENLEFIIWPVVGQRTYCVFARHQTEADVIELMREVRTLFPKIPYFLSRIDELLAGKAKILPAKMDGVEMKASNNSDSHNNAVVFVSPKSHVKKTPQEMANEEPTSSTPWSVIVILIVATIGLLWLLLKRRS